MKKFIQQALLLPLVLFTVFNSANAKIWRVNNNPGIVADFTQLSTAVVSPLVLDGDTIYVEPTEDSYSSLTLRKRLTLIGVGYYLNENTGLQYSSSSSFVSSIILDSLASGSKIMGLRLNQIYTNSSVDNISISRCQFAMYNNTSTPNSRMVNWKIDKCYLSAVSISSAAYVFENMEIRNCIISSTFSLPNQINGLFRNNTSFGVWTISNSYVSNNIFLGNGSHTFTNCTVKYNISQGNSNLPAGNNNQLGIPANTLVVNSGTTDGRYMLAAGSPAIGAGEPVNGITPDAGAFGTADPYKLSGIPPIPAIYELVVPTNVPSSATTMNITISTRSNN